MNLVSRIALAVLLVAAVVALGWNVYYRAVQSEKGRSDFLMFRAAGQAVLDDADIYSIEHRRGWPFYYPPTMAVAMVPFALMPLGPGVIVWYAIAVGALFWAGYRLVLLCDQLAGKQVGVFVVAAFLVNFGAIGAGLQRGQISPLLFMLMVEAFWSYRQGRPALCGVWIALAASLKLYPILLILPIALRRDWRGLAGFGAALLVLSGAVPIATMGPAIGWETIRHFVSTIAFPFFADPSYAAGEVFGRFNQFSPSNQSLFGVLSRWLAGGALPDHEPFALSLANLSVVAVRLMALSVSAVLLVVMSVVALLKTDRRSWPEAVIWCLPMVAANFISHIAWHHYYVVLTFAYALAFTGFKTLPRSRERACLTWILGIALIGNWLHFSVYLCRQMGALLLSSILLWVVLAALARRGIPRLRP